MSRPPIFLRGRVERIGSFELNGESFLALSFRAETSPSAFTAELSWIRAPRAALGDEESFALSLAQAGDTLEAFVEPSPDDARTLVSPDSDARAASPQNLVALCFPDIAPVPSHFTRTRENAESLESAQSLDEAIEGESAGEEANYSFGFPAAHGSSARSSRVVPRAAIADLSVLAVSPAQPARPGATPSAESDLDAQTHAWQADSVPRRVYAEALSQILSEIDSEAWKQKTLARILWRQGLRLFSLAVEGKTLEASAVAKEMAHGFRSLDAELTERSSARRANALMDAAFRWAGSESRPKDGEPGPRLAAAGEFMPARAQAPARFDKFDKFDDRGPALASLGREGINSVFSTPDRLFPWGDDSAFSGSEFTIGEPRSAESRAVLPGVAAPEGSTAESIRSAERAAREALEAETGATQSPVELTHPGHAESLPSLDDLLNPAPVLLISQRDAAELQLHDESALDELLALAARDPDPLSLAQTQLDDPSWGGAVERFVSENAPEILREEQPDSNISLTQAPLPQATGRAAALRLVSSVPARVAADARAMEPLTQDAVEKSAASADDFSQPSRPPVSPLPAASRDERSAAPYAE